MDRPEPSQWSTGDRIPVLVGIVAWWSPEFLHGDRSAVNGVRHPCRMNSTRVPRRPYRWSGMKTHPTACHELIHFLTTVTVMAAGFISVPLSASLPTHACSRSSASAKKNRVINRCQSGDDDKNNQDLGAGLTFGPLGKSKQR